MQGLVDGEAVDESTPMPSVASNPRVIKEIRQARERRGTRLERGLGGDKSATLALAQDVAVPIVPAMKDSSTAFAHAQLADSYGEYGLAAELYIEGGFNAGIATAEAVALAFGPIGALAVHSASVPAKSTVAKSLSRTAKAAAAGGGGPKTFSNLFPDEAVGTGNLRTLGQLQQAENTFLYVVRQDGSLVLSARKGHIHSQLAGGQPVRAAGEVKLLKGEVKSLNDRSGHFMNRPMTPEERASVKAEAEAAFTREGADAAGKFEFLIQRPRNQ